MMLTPEEVQALSMEERIRALKVLTPGRYDLHSWVDDHNTNGLIVDTLLLTVSAGGIFIAGIPE